MDIETILKLQSLDLTPYEIRGAKVGINNARSTGPVYIDGTYVPANSAVYGSGTFSSDGTVTGFSFDTPYGALTTAALRPQDSVIYDSTTYKVMTILSSDSFTMDKTSTPAGYHGLSLSLGQREYVIEPDVEHNTFTNGTATFSKNSLTVTGVGTTWASDLTSGDFIKFSRYQKYFRIDQVVDNSTLLLVSAYDSDTTTGDYVAKKWKIGSTEVRYSTNNIQYDNQAAKWKYDSINQDSIPTSTSPVVFADGITAAYTRALNVNKPDIMDVAVTDKVFARKTQYETSQFSLPVVPYPEYTVSVYVNDVLKDQYPFGNRDYVLHYSQNPDYEVPPPPNNRSVANIMFLNAVSNVQPDQSLTRSGQVAIIDSTGTQISGILPGSESIIVNETALIPHRDYMLEAGAGILEITDSILDEQIVKYVSKNYSDVIDYGFTVYKNGVKQKISFPPEADDDLLFNPDTGRIKPQGQEHIGIDEIYEVHYMVEAATITDEIIPVYTGLTSFTTSLYPIKQNSINLTKTSTEVEYTSIIGKASATKFLIENEDFFVSHMTGRISLVQALGAGETLAIDYTPLSTQVNDLSYADGNPYCTVHDSRLNIEDSVNYTFSLQNKDLKVTEIEVLRIYNETKDKDYNLTNLVAENGKITLIQDSTNTSIGLRTSDIVVIDYKFESGVLEYFPVSVNYLELAENMDAIYIEGSDITSEIVPGAILNLTYPESSTQIFVTVTSANYDGYGTRIYLETKLPSDITNPKIYISDASVTYDTIPLAARPIVTGTVTLQFHGHDISNLFRTKTLLNLNSDIYQVSSAVYAQDIAVNEVTLTSEVVHDYTSSTTLLNVGYSDCPVYLEADTEIMPRLPAVNLMYQTGFIANNSGDTILTVISDSSAISIDGSSYLYGTQTLSELSAILTAAIPTLTLTTYVPTWKADKLVPASVYIYEGSNTVLSVRDDLRYHGSDSTVFTDSTNFSISDTGAVVLTQPLVRGDRYNLDYLGREYLSDSTLKYSLNYFVDLPVSSKVQAAFQFDNLDQFYIQVLDRRTFFESVSKPSLEEEATQLNDNQGQGGEVNGDEGSAPSDGGLSGLEFRRQDAAITERIFENIYDFFSNRLQAFGDEMQAGLGWKMFNNDGYFNKTQQSVSHKVVGRIFPTSDYTNMEPVKVNPITGYFFGNGAIFTKDTSFVYSPYDDDNDPLSTRLATDWPLQLSEGDFIGRLGTDKRYKIKAVDSTQITLYDNFEETSTVDWVYGEGYTAGNRYPLYDDDGHMRAKLIGTKNKKFRIRLNDVFDCNLGSYTFDSPFAPFYSADTVAEKISSIPGLSCTVENVLDPNTPYGYRTALVLRTVSSNALALGSGKAVRKAGFIPGAVSYGSLDPTITGPEILWDRDEKVYLEFEAKDIQLAIDAGLSNKLERIITTYYFGSVQVSCTQGSPIITRTSGLAWPTWAAPGVVVYIDTAEYNEIISVDDSFQITLLYPFSEATDTYVIRKGNYLGIIDDVYTQVEAELIDVENEIPKLETEVNATSIIIREQYIPPYSLSYGPTLIAYDNAVAMLQNGRDQSAYDSSIVPSWEGKLVDWKWALDLTEHEQDIKGRDATDVGVDTSSGPGIIPIGGQTYFIVDAPSDNDRRILKATMPDSSAYTPKLFYSDTSAVVSGTWSGWDPSVSNSYSTDHTVRFDLNSSAIIFVKMDPAFSVPEYTADTSAIAFDWAETEGFKHVSLPYSSSPTIGDLVNAINANDGFGASALVDPGFSYVNLEPGASIPLGNYPGVIINAGTQPPAFGISNLDTPNPVAAFGLYSTDTTSPLYVADSSAIVITQIDGTNTTTTEFLYGSYGTLGALETALGSVVNVTSIFDPLYAYGSLVPDAGVLSNTPPGTSLYINYVAPAYEVDSSAVAIIKIGATGFNKSEFLYASYGTLGALETALSSVVTVTSIFDPLYVYGALRPDSGTLAMPVDLYLNVPPPVIQVYFEMLNPRYQTDLTSVTVSWEQGLGTQNRVLSYASNLTVADMKLALNNINLIDATGNNAYNTEHCAVLRFSSGPLDTGIDATLYRGLRDCFVTYQTISDKRLNDRNYNLSGRLPTITQRIDYLENTREDEIRDHVKTEQLLRTPEGAASDLYTWANNRYNRRQGSYAKLKQIEQQIVVNQSALNINRSFMG